MHKPDDKYERSLPCDEATERFILGSVLLDDSHFVAVCASLSAADFSLEKHRRIFAAMTALGGRGERIDRVTTATELQRSGQLESIDGISYLISLDDGLPQLTHIDSYLKIVRDKSILRKTIHIADGIRDRAMAGGEFATELLGNAESMLAQLGVEASDSSEFLNPGEVIRRAGSLQKYLERGVEFGVPAGFPGLDRMTCGMRPGQLWIVGGYTSSGKSTLARNMAKNAAAHNYPGAFVTLEMQSEEVTDGLICAQGEIDSQVIRRGLDFERSRTRQAAVIVSDLPIYIRDRGTCTLPQLHAGLRKLQSERGITWAIIDYLQLMSGTGRSENRTQEVSQFSRGLKQIASDLKIPIVALSQLKRTGDVPRRPQLSDLRESGTIEQDANVVLLLYSEKIDVDMEVYPTELIVAKQRGGPTGVIQLGFNKAHGIFREFEMTRS